MKTNCYDPSNYTNTVTVRPQDVYNTYSLFTMVLIKLPSSISSIKLCDKYLQEKINIKLTTVATLTEFPLSDIRGHNSYMEGPAQLTELSDNSLLSELEGISLKYHKHVIS